MRTSHWLAAVLITSLVGFACGSSSDSKSSKDTKPRAGDDDDDDAAAGDDDDDDDTAAAADDDAALPTIEASKLGGDCAGGTGVGQTAALTDDRCPTKLCLADATEALDLYCSADCDKVTCPAGYECRAVDSGHADRACFKAN